MGPYLTSVREIPETPSGQSRLVKRAAPPTMVAMNDVPAPTTRARHGRWLGGVCAGLAARWGVPVARVRLGFVLASALVGLGVLVYLAAWLILPGEGEDGGQRGIVLLAQASARCSGS